MNKNYNEIILHFYSEAIQHDFNSALFLENGKHITKLYRENIGMTPKWFDYQKSLDKNEETVGLDLLSSMKDELLKLN